jgi:uridine phosphorylase
MPTELPAAAAAAFARDDHAEPSLFLPESLLRESRRQRHLNDGDIPAICLLDPDGDVVRHLQNHHLGHRSGVWACYHTDLWQTNSDGETIGVVGQAVGAPFAVLVAEQLFASGCELVVSVTSAGQIDLRLGLPCTILVDRALRGEGTSYAYLPAGEYAHADDQLVQAVSAELDRSGIETMQGSTWTTDAPFRETASAITAARNAGIKAVEMESAGLYAFAQARSRPVVCFALVTNQMAQFEGDFEKGPGDGAEHALQLTAAAARGWRALNQSRSGVPVAQADQLEDT